MQTSMQKPLYWGRTYDRDGSNRFVFWHRYSDHLIQLSGFLRNGEPIIEQIKEGKQVRPVAGLPHFGYAFEWKPIGVAFDALKFVALGQHFQKWVQVKASTIDT